MFSCVEAQIPGWIKLSTRTPRARKRRSVQVRSCTIFLATLRWTAFARTSHGAATATFAPSEWGEYIDRARSETAVTYATTKRDGIIPNCRFQYFTPTRKSPRAVFLAELQYYVGLHFYARSTYAVSARRGGRGGLKLLKRRKKKE